MDPVLKRGQGWFPFSGSDVGAADPEVLGDPCRGRSPLTEGATWTLCQGSHMMPVLDMGIHNCFVGHLEKDHLFSPVS